MLEGKKAVIFDLDGTLIDSVDVWNNADFKLIKLLSDESLHPEDIEAVWRDRDDFLKDNPQGDVYLNYCQYLKEKYKIKETADEINNSRRKMALDYMHTSVRLKPGVPEFLKYLKTNNYKIALATLSTKWAVEQYETNKNIGNIINEYFDLILTKDDVHHGKPNPEIYLKALEELKLSPDDCLVFEDSLSGIKAGMAAKIEVCCVYDRSSDPDRTEINNLVGKTYASFADVLNLI